MANLRHTRHGSMSSQREPGSSVTVPVTQSSQIHSEDHRLSTRLLGPFNKSLVQARIVEAVELEPPAEALDVFEVGEAGLTEGRMAVPGPRCDRPPSQPDLRLPVHVPLESDRRHHHRMLFTLPEHRGRNIPGPHRCQRMWSNFNGRPRFIVAAHSEACAGTTVHVAFHAFGLEQSKCLSEISDRDRSAHRGMLLSRQ